MNLKIVLLSFVILGICEGLDLPSYFPKCKKSDPDLSKCATTSLQKGWREFVKGDDSYHILQIDPLLIPFLHCRVDENIYGNMTNSKYVGLADLIFKQVKVDLEKQRIDIKYFMPYTTMTGDYELMGKLFGLPLGGTGRANVTFVNGNFNYFFTYKLNEKKGKQYADILESVIKYEDIENVSLNLKFENNNLGEAISAAFNENWRELSAVTDSVGLSMGTVYAEILRAFFKKVPFTNFFAAE